MRLRYVFSAMVGVSALALSVMTPVGARAVRPDAATLKKIASRVDSRAGVVTIEASDPVPYVTSQPDPRVLVLELRDVVATGFSDQFTPDPRNPVAAVQVESAHAVDGADIARVRLTLSQPMRPRVRSSRNIITVEADRPENGVTSQSGMISMAGPASAIRDVRVMQRGRPRRSRSSAPDASWRPTCRRRPRVRIVWSSTCRTSPPRSGLRRRSSRGRWGRAHRVEPEVGPGDAGGHRDDPRVAVPTRERA
jgi:hypothetical protein